LPRRAAAERAPTTEELSLLNARLQSALAEVAETLDRAKATSHVAIERFVSIRFRGQTNHLDVPVSSDGFGREEFAEMTALSAPMRRNPAILLSRCCRRGRTKSRACVT